MMCDLFDGAIFWSHGLFSVAFGKFLLHVCRFPHNAPTTKIQISYKWCYNIIYTHNQRRDKVHISWRFHQVKGFRISVETAVGTSPHVVPFLPADMTSVTSCEDYLVFTRSIIYSFNFSRLRTCTPVMPFLATYLAMVIPGNHAFFVVWFWFWFWTRPLVVPFLPTQSTFESRIDAFLL